MKYLVILILSISFFQVQAQKIDSLQKELKNCQKDSVCIKIYLSLSGATKYTQPQEAIAYAQKGLALSQELKIAHLEAEAWNSLGITESGIGNYSKALECYQKGMELSLQAKNKQTEASILTNIGSVHIMQGNFAKGLQKNLEALNIYEQIGDKKSIAKAYNNIGTVYEHNQEYDKAIEYVEKALNLKKELGDTQAAGTSYSNLGNLYAIKQNYPKALEYYEEATKIGKAGNNLKLLSNNYTNIGYMYWEQGLFDKSLAQYKLSLELDRQMGDTHGIALSLMNVASIEKEMKQYEAALGNLQEALKITESLGVKNDIQKVLKDLAELYAAMNQYDKAFLMHQRFVNVKDSVFSELKTKQIAELRTKYETDKKEQENKLLQAENQKKVIQLYFLVIAIVLLFAIGVIVLKLKQSQLKNSELKIETQSKDLIGYAQNLIEKDNLIDEIQLELQKTREGSEQHKIENVEQLLNSKLSTENDWLRFKQRFEVVYPDFFMNLQKQYPQLSPTEVKICAIEKLGIKDAEAGDILGINPESVKKSRYRLRKNLSDTEKLALKSFIENY